MADSLCFENRRVPCFLSSFPRPLVLSSCGSLLVQTAGDIEGISVIEPEVRTGTTVDP